MCLPNFNGFGILGRNFITQKFKDSLIALVLMISKSVMPLLCLCLDKYRFFLCDAKKVLVNNGATSGYYYSLSDYDDAM